MKDINQEFRFFEKDPTNNEKDPNELYVVEDEATLIIDEFGNLVKNPKKSHTYFLGEKAWSKGFHRKSKSYYGIKHISDDHYVVINILTSEIDNENLLESKRFQLKFGIIKLNRESRHRSIENEKEEIIAPIIYDRIYIYDNLYPIVEINGRYTYFCLDTESKNYGKQLVPLVLESASPFNIKYPGFAECIIEGETRFIPIDYIATESITKDDLLTEEDIIYLMNSYEKFEKLQKATNSKIPRLVKKLQN